MRHTLHPICQSQMPKYDHCIVVTIALEKGGGCLPAVYWIIAGVALILSLLSLTGIVGYAWPIVIAAIFVVACLALKSRRKSE